MEWGRQLSVNRMGMVGAGRQAMLEGWYVPAGALGCLWCFPVVL